MIQLPDLINGSFELFGAPFIFFSIIKLHRQKCASGVSWLHVSYFMSWGIWNLYYYPYLDQWFSFFGGVAIVIANLIWLAQVIYYTYAEQKEKG